jgi:predicted nucleic acid-binding protein
MGKPLVFDSTPLIYLARASLSKFFSDIAEEKFATHLVFKEVVDEGNKKGAPEASVLERLFTEETLKIQDPTEKEFLRYAKELAAKTQKHPLHEAEAETLSLARELNGIAIADDRVVRVVASLLDIEMHGTGYILGKIYATGKITKAELLEKMENMRAYGWRLSDEDYFKITEYIRNL